jgi:hypothetical protein
MGELSENQFLLWIVEQDKQQVEMSDFMYVHHSRLHSVALSASHIALHSLCNFFSMVWLALFDGDCL